MFHLPTKVHYGIGVAERIKEFLQNRIPLQRVLLVRGGKSFEKLSESNYINLDGIDYVEYSVSGGEPTLKHLEEGLKIARDENITAVIGIGGGSVLDTAKAIARLYYSQCDVREHFYRKAELPKEVIPFVAIPTTAGTGSEVTAVSVFIDPQEDYKGSIGNRLWFPDVAIVDPRLTLTAPRDVTLSSGLDALTHALEAMASNQADEFTIRLAWSAAEMIFETLPEVLRDPSNLYLRERMTYASLLAGMVFGNVGVGLAHALGHAFGVVYNIPHGITCAMSMPFVWQVNAPYFEELLSSVINLSSEDIRRRIWILYETIGFNPSRPLGRELEIDNDSRKRLIRITMSGRSLRTNRAVVTEELVSELIDQIVRVSQH